MQFGKGEEGSKKQIDDVHDALNNQGLGIQEGGRHASEREC